MEYVLAPKAPTLAMMQAACAAAYGASTQGKAGLATAGIIYLAMLDEFQSSAPANLRWVATDEGST